MVEHKETIVTKDAIAKLTLIYTLTELQAEYLDLSRSWFTDSDKR